MVFSVQHKIVGMVSGRFDKTSGTIVVSKNPADCSLEVTIDAASLSTQNPIRDADVKGTDFFDAAKFPAADVAHGAPRTWNGLLLAESLSLDDGRGVSGFCASRFCAKRLRVPMNAVLALPQT